MFESINIQSIFNIAWFSIETLKSFEWEKPFFLYLIPLVPLSFLLRWIFQLSTNSKLKIAVFGGSFKFNPLTILRFLPMLFINLALILILIALARPQKVNELVEQWTEGIDISLILDTSSSMKAEDFKPNRLEAAKRVAQNFIDGRTQDRIGLVVFAAEAYSLSPLTTDYKLLKTLIDDVKIGIIPKDGTAIGTALAVGINRMMDSKAKSKVIILLSDGDNTAGSIEPLTAAELAYGYGIKIYTIGIGKEGKVPYGKNMFGITQYVESSLDETTMRKISEITGAKFFRASNNKALQEIFDIIDQFEKSEIKENRFKSTQDYYRIYLYWSLLMLLIFLLLKSTFMNNFLED